MNPLELVANGGSPSGSSYANPARPDESFGASDQDAAINSFVALFYAGSSRCGNFVIDNRTRKPPGPLDFWRMAEELEMAEDVYYRTGDQHHRALCECLYLGFVDVHGTDWTENIYNDDLMWITMATVRLFGMTADARYYQQAKSCFDHTWSRAFDSTDGGLWWTTDNTSKNACIAGPAAIAALLLYRHGGDPGYLDKARAAFQWEVGTLYDPSGLVRDNISADGVISGGATTYNQGTFIGAAHLLNQLTASAEYEPFALAAARYTRDHCTEKYSPGVLRAEYAQADGGCDNAGFKGIFARWCGRWARETGNAEILSWLQHNVRVVLDHRNERGVTWGHWGTPTPEEPVTAWECSGAVSLLQNVPPQ